MTLGITRGRLFEQTQRTEGDAGENGVEGQCEQKHDGDDSVSVRNLGQFGCRFNVCTREQNNYNHIMHTEVQLWLCPAR